ncbi:MAG: hypothetical protein J5545_09975, partial [Bacteroidaceae bacterium]|nr:hypothetical protein [Bacteroidaceae bacterium]
QPIHWLVRNGGEKRVPLGTRQQIPLAYLKARIPLVTTLPANELAGYPYQMPTALTFQALDLWSLRNLEALGPKGRLTLQEPLLNAYGITCES